MNQNVKLDKQKDSPVTTIHGFSHDGRGIASVDNKTTFVKGALPAETVSYKINQKRGSFNEAEALAILEPSPERAIPPCQHFGVCGGCSLQHMSNTLQLQLKQQTLLEQLKHFGHVEPEIILAPLNANTLGYRRKARLGVKFVIKKNKLLVGFREKSSSYLAELERCIVLHPQIGERFSLLSELITSMDGYKQIPQVEVAIGDTQMALVFRHLESLSESDTEKLLNFASTHNIHIYLQPNSPAPVQQLWPAHQPNRISYTLPDYALQFHFHPLDFTQINLEMNRLMVKQALTLLDVQKEDKVLDLFCGIGNFSLAIARTAKHVTGIEGGEDMVARAKENALLNDIKNTEFYAANLAAPGKAAWMNVSYDKILLDPPRTGAKEILAFCAQSGAKKIVYVSCNPATLARDAGELVNVYGYKLKQAGMMNMFPHTSHIEAMAVFEKI